PVTSNTPTHTASVRTGLSADAVPERVIDGLERCCWSSKLREFLFRTMNFEPGDRGDAHRALHDLPHVGKMFEGGVSAIVCFPAEDLVTVESKTVVDSPLLFLRNGEERVAERFELIELSFSYLPVGMNGNDTIRRWHRTILLDTLCLRNNHYSSFPRPPLKRN